MHGNRIQVKDDQSDYVVHYPYPCEYFSPIGQDIPDNGVLWVSIDPAIKNFAIRIERRYKTGHAETVQMVKADFRQYGNVSETKGTTTIEPKILASALETLRYFEHYFKESQLIIIERQPGINYKSSRIFQHVLTYFMMIVPTFTHYCVILDVSPKLKGKMLGAPKNISKIELKKWGIEKAIEILTVRKDEIALKIIDYHRGTSKTKADDIADTIIQIEGLLVLLNGAYTRLLKTVYLGIDEKVLIQQQLLDNYMKQCQAAGIDPLQLYLMPQ